jgi:hypothetical protein
MPRRIKVLLGGVNSPPGDPNNILWQGTANQGFVPPYSSTDIVGGTSDVNNEWSVVEMDGNSVALNNAPTLSFDSTLRYNNRPGFKSVKFIMKGTNSTGSGTATQRAQFRANPDMLPYWSPTANGNDNEVWFGFAFYLGTGYVLNDLTATNYHNVAGFRHFTSNDSTFYLTVESEDGGLVMRRATTSTWSDGLGSDQMMVGAVNLGWNTVVLHAKLSTTSTNALREVWVNGVYGGAQTTANITGTSDVRLRMGPYNNPNFANDRTFALDNIRVGNNFNSVNPEVTT